MNYKYTKGPKVKVANTFNKYYFVGAMYNLIITKRVPYRIDGRIEYTSPGYRSELILRGIADGTFILNKKAIYDWIFVPTVESLAAINRVTPCVEEIKDRVNSWYTDPKVTNRQFASNLLSMVESNKGISGRVSDKVYDKNKKTPILK